MGAAEASATGMSMKTLSLATLTLQSSALYLLMHYSRTQPLTDGHRYIYSTAIFLNEVMKLALSLTILMYDISRTLPPQTPATVLFEQLYNSVFSGDGWKMAFPATLYTLLNSLQYIAVSNIDAVHFQIIYQLKILATALFSLLLLRKGLSSKKWVSLVLLTIGVAVVQLPSGDSSAYLPVKNDQSRFFFPRSLHELGQLTTGATDVARELTKRGVEGLVKRSATYEGIQEDLGLVKPVMNYSVGLAAVLSAAVVSGWTGVYFEKVLKESNTHVSVWTRNVQLSFCSLFSALIFGVVFVDGEEVAKNGFFIGYNSTVWAVIVFQALGGIIVSMVINYADNISKNFATSISIITSLIVSLLFSDLKLSLNFVLGTALVVYATYLYAMPETRRSRPPPINIIDFEKTTIDNGFTPRYDEDKQLFLDLPDSKSPGFSTSRPSSPMRHHSRVGSSRGKIKRED